MNEPTRKYDCFVWVDIFNDICSGNFTKN